MASRRVCLDHVQVLVISGLDGKLPVQPAYYPVDDGISGYESWSIEVRNYKGEAVRRFTGSGLPQSLVFDGYSDSGSVVDDGEYTAVMQVNYRGGQQPTTASPNFIVDTQPPQAVVRVSSAVFSPDGDGNKDTIEVRQSSSTEVAWTGTLTSASGGPVLTQVWEGAISSFVWDGTVLSAP